MKKYFVLISLVVLLAACRSVESINATATAAPVEYTVATDETGVIQISVPTTWEDVDGRKLEMASKRFVTIAASTDLSDYSNYAAPGIYLLVNSGPIGAGQTLDEWKNLYTSAPENCEYVSQADYQDAKYQGKLDFFKNCKSAHNSYTILVANPVDHPTAYTLTFMFNSPTGETNAALTSDIQKLLGTFLVTGSLP